MIYELQNSIEPLGSAVQQRNLAAPPGTSMELQLVELLKNFPVDLALPQVTVVTPWADRQSDLDWQEITKPDTNISLFSIDDAKIKRATEVNFGQPLPFVTVFSDRVKPLVEVSESLSESPYELYQTHAVYRQDDGAVVPKIHYLYWLRRRPAEAGKTPKSMDQVAKELLGYLTFSQQVPVEGTSLRSAPDVSFQEALETEKTPVQPVPPVQPEPEPLPVVQSEVRPAYQWLGLLLVGAATAAGTVAFAKAVRK